MPTGLDSVSTFPIRDDYDWTKSTSENYVNKSKTDFVGKYVKERKMLDYSWHCNISRNRQKWQDEVIDSIVKKVAPQSNPWIVYTCGPMGAGKGYCLTWMSQHGYVRCAACSNRQCQPQPLPRQTNSFRPTANAIPCFGTRLFPSYNTLNAW